MKKMKKDPLSISTSLVLNLNLLRENVEYNINEVKSLRNLENHWKTIHKYIKMFKIIKEYCPKIELNDSKFIIKDSELYKRLDQVEQFILYLSNNNSIGPESAIEIPEEFDIEQISESEEYLYKRTDDGKFYLTKSGNNIFRLIKQNLSEVIFQEKSFDELFPYEYEEINVFFHDFKIDSTEGTEISREYNIDCSNIYSGNIEVNVISERENTTEQEVIV